MHGQCTLIVDPRNGAPLGVLRPKQRLAPAAYGGNWHGTKYLTYREHDRYTRLRRLPMNAPPIDHHEAIRLIEKSRR